MIDRAKHKRSGLAIMAAARLLKVPRGAMVQRSGVSTSLSGDADGAMLTTMTTKTKTKMQG